MRTHSRVYAKVNLSAVRHNMEQMYKNLKPGTKMMAVVKANAYGHGAVHVSSVMEDLDYVWGYGVATLEEAFELRDAGRKKPIMILGYTYPDQYEEIVRQGFQVTVFKRNMAEALSKEAIRQGKELSIHVKIDTGMNRIGYKASSDPVEEIAYICGLPNLRKTGIFSHFAKADERDKTFARGQIEQFRHIVSRLKEKGINFEMQHISASAGIIDIIDGNMDLVRAGIAIYGLYPSEEVDKQRVKLKPVLSLHSQVVYVKEIEAGEPISYGGTFTAEKRMRIATIPIGYGDGWPRSLSNKGYVLIHGERAPIVGRVCMDQFMVDVSHIPVLEEGAEVVLIGKSGDTFLPVEAMAHLSGRFNYEFMCCLGRRIPRIYVEE